MPLFKVSCVVPIPKSSQSSVVALASVLVFWILLVGLSIRETLIALFVIALVCAWGLLAVSALGRKLISTNDLGFWMLGPCLGIGTLCLLFLRLATSKSVFLSLFVVVPVIWAVYRMMRATKSWKPRQLTQSQFGISVSTFYSWLLFLGITGIPLLQNWNWIAPIVMVAFASVLISSSLEIQSRYLLPLTSLGMLGSVGLAINFRPSNWWQLAEGIPFDEAILETIANGLVQWGPSTMPIHHELSGASAVAYHHLLYLVVGLVTQFSGLASYEALLLVAPVLTMLSITSSLFLIVKKLMRNSDSSIAISWLVVLGLVAFLLGLRGEGFGSPSTMFGSASVLASFVILSSVMDVSLTWRASFLVCVSVVTIAFSKGLLVYAPALFVLVLALWNWRQRWKLTVVVLVAVACVTAWFSWASVATNTFSITFWPRARMFSTFELNFYTLKVFIQILLLPLLFGFASVIIMAFTQSPALRQYAFSLFFIMVAAVMSQLFLTSTGPRNFEIFYVPGIFAASLSVALLSMAARSEKLVNRYEIATILILGSVLVWQVPRLQRSLITPTSVAVVFSLGVGCVLWAIRRSDFIRGHWSTGDPLRSTAILLSALTVTVFIVQDFTELPIEYQPSAEKVQADWYGNKDFADAVQFIKSSTSSDALFAYSICGAKADEVCEVDFRPSALTTRKFLALYPLFGQEDVSPNVWSAVELVRSIGHLPADQTVSQLIERGVDYLWVSSSRIDGKWLEALDPDVTTIIFSNTGNTVIELLK